jgi:hypothetical protein
MPSDIAKIKLILPNLSLKELDDVLLSAKMWREKKVKGVVDTTEQLLYESIIEQLGIKLSEKFLNFFIFRTKRPSDYALLVETVEWANPWIKINFPNSKSTDKRRIFVFITELVIEHVEQSPAPLGLTSVLRQFKNITGLLEKAYPGYLESGLLHLILETKYSSWPENDLNVEV